MIGQTIGKYRVVDRVGRGGMGTVYRAFDDTLHREVAIKVLNAELNDPGVARRFRAEAVAIARLNHPGIATIYELLQHEGQWLMVMEFVRGETLDNLIARRGPLPPDLAVELCMQVLSALAHAHSMGVVHRDLKPANIMWTENGVTKITDFGIARVAGTEHLTSAGHLIGTPAFMAPEQVLGGDIDARTDLYAMGVVLYYLTTAKLPFRGDTPLKMAQSRIKDLPTPIRAIRQELPAWFAHLTDRALTRALDRRFQTAEEFHEALRLGVTGLSFETQPAFVLPPELMATAGPGAIPLPSPSEPTPVATPMPSVKTPATPTAAPPPKPPTLTPESMPTMGRATESDGVSLSVPSSTTKLKRRLAVIAALVIVAVIAGFVWMRQFGSANRSAQQSAPSAPAAERSTPPGPAPTDPAPAVPGTPASSGPQPTDRAITSGTSSGSPTVPAGRSPAPIAPAPRSTEAGARGTTPPPVAGASPGLTPPLTTGAAGGAGDVVGPGRSAAAAPGREGGAAAAIDTVLRVDNLKQLVVTDRNSTDRDVWVYFGGGLISIVAAPGGKALGSLPYLDLAAATYARGRDPKWDPSLAAPPQNLDVGGAFRRARHWLVLQSKAQYVILRLDDANWAQVIEALTARTGVKVVRADR